MPLTYDDFFNDSKLELYNEVIKSLHEQEDDGTEEQEYQLDLEDEE